MAKRATDKYQPKPYMGRERKEKIVAEFAEKTGNSKAFVFTNYQGLTHIQLEQLKKAVKKLNAEYVITKNRLLLIALKDQNLSDEDKAQFENPTATLFMYDDYIEPIKALSKVMKELSLPVVKFGIIDGKTMAAEDIAKLATLPSLPDLQAKLVGVLNSPIYGLHRALSWNLQSLVMTLKSIETKKQSAS